MAYDVPDGCRSPWLCTAEFTVDEESRTVELSMKGNASGVTRATAKAKCKDNDVFNADIGKAICLGRAMGLDVSEFENSIHPELAIGQVTSIINAYSKRETGQSYEVCQIDKYGYPVYTDGEFASHYRITNDTNAQY